MGIIFLVLFIALITFFVTVEVNFSRHWNGWWRVAALFPGALFLLVILNIVIGTMIDKTSHNLWPMELVMWSTGGIGYLGILVLIRKIRGV